MHKKHESKQNEVIEKITNQLSFIEVGAILELTLEVVS
jgi:hypothetical protein